MPTLQVKIHNFSGTTVVAVDGEKHGRRDVVAKDHCLITAELYFMPDHIWFWIDGQEGKSYKANVEIKWVERNLVVYYLKNGDGVKGEKAKVFSPDFSGHIEQSPSQVRTEARSKLRTDPIYHIDDFSY